MDTTTSPDLHAIAAEVARQIRAVVAELNDPDSELTATPATRNRLEGAAIAFGALTG